MNKIISFIILLVSITAISYSQPKIGAEIWIEPGQTEQQIDTWFRILNESQMPVARIFIMWNYINPKKDVWDFTLYDYAFKAAEKYNVKIQATLTANHGAPFLQPFFNYKEQEGVIPKDTQHLNQIDEYIEKVVSRYKSSSSLENWWLMNEPGQLNSHDELAMFKYKKWLKEKYSTVEALNSAWISDFSDFDSIQYHSSWDGAGGFTRPAAYLDWNWFWRDHLTWYMQWIAESIQKYDTTHSLHVNPHGIFDILPKYDLPKWRNFTGSFGASIHPSWHFAIFNRNQYALGVSAVCDIIKGASGTHPYWISELQGGNNIWSGGQPLCPTPQDISQWVWSGIGSGAEKVIFWCLNWRVNGGEAGEWSMLSFQNEPSDRLIEASNIAKAIDKNKSLFSQAKPIAPKVTILLSPETMLIQWRKDLWQDIEGRGRQAHIKSVLAYYETLLQLGIPVELRQIDDFDFENQTNHIAILANAISVKTSDIQKFENFVKAGNKMIVSGLTGFFDENETNVLQTTNPMQSLLGGLVKEVKLIDNQFDILVKNTTMPVNLWMSEIQPTTGKSIGTRNNQTIALENKLGNGTVIWIPACIELGARASNNNGLTAFLKKELGNAIADNLFTFSSTSKNVLVKTLTSDKELITVITNGENVSTEMNIKCNKGLNPYIIYGQSKSFSKLKLQPRESLVIGWK